MNNRDWWESPVQDSRSAYDYGRSNAPFESEPYRRTGWVETLVAMVIVFAVVVFAFTR